MSVEIREISEKEIWVEKCKVELGDDGIFYQSLAGDIDEEIVAALQKAFLKLINLVNGDIIAFVDLSESGMQYSKARKKAIAGFEQMKIKKIALYGVHPVAKVIANFFMSAANNDKVRMFNSKEKALEWLASN